MQHFKAFTSAICQDDLGQLEHMINEWLENEHPHIHYMAQSTFDQHLVITFVYAKRPEHATAVATAEAEVPEVFERTLEHADLDPSGRVHVPLPQVELPY